MMQKKILIADDHEIIHIGITNVLENNPEFLITGHAYTGKEAIEKADTLKPDIILMDISMPEGNGLFATHEIMKINPQIKIIALSQHDDNAYISQMIQAGCFGYLLKNSRKEEILKALASVVRGKKYMNPDIIDKLMSGNSGFDNAQIRLTKRETEVLKKIAKGNNNPEIAHKLSISVRTVETHRRNLMQKLKAKTVVELLRQASKFKLIDI